MSKELDPLKKAKPEHRKSGWIKWCIINVFLQEIGCLHSEKRPWHKNMVKQVYVLNVNASIVYDRPLLMTISTCQGHCWPWTHGAVKLLPVQRHTPSNSHQRLLLRASVRRWLVKPRFSWLTSKEFSKNKGQILKLITTQLNENN